MLVVDMSKPWTALDSLQKWASVVREHIDKLKIPPEEMKEMEQKSEYLTEWLSGFFFISQVIYQMTVPFTR